MHLKSKQIAFLGVLAAIAVLFVVLSGIIEPNTLVFLGLASLCVGVSISEMGIKMGIAFYIAVVLLSLIIAPVKLYCLTFAIVSLYVVISEGIMRFTEAHFSEELLQRMRYLFKFVAFNVLYVPVMVFAPKLLYSGTPGTGAYIGMFVVGQAVLVLYDQVYICLMNYYQTKLRKRLNL